MFSGGREKVHWKPRGQSTFKSTPTFPETWCRIQNHHKSSKKGIKHLRNEKLRQETDKINENANPRKIEELWKIMKDGNTAFKTKRVKQLKTTPPDIGKLRSTIKSLKSDKSANDVPSDY